MPASSKIKLTQTKENTLHPSRAYNDLNAFFKNTSPNKDSIDKLIGDISTRKTHSEEKQSQIFQH